MKGCDTVSNANIHHDMSGDSVKLNLDDLITMAGHAVQNACMAMNHWQKEVDNAIYMPDRMDTDGHFTYRVNHHMQFYADLMAISAREYADALANYHYLVETKRREFVSLIK